MTDHPPPRTIVLIGATSGIGRQAALQLAVRGHRLILVGRDRRRGDSLVAEIGNDRGRTRSPVFIAGDVSTAAGVAEVVADITNTTNAVDTLINNAGIMAPKRQLTSEGIELNFAVHHLAPYSMAAMLMPQLARGDGRTVNTNSEGHRAALFHSGAIDIDFSDLQSERHYDAFLAYSRTKLANLLFTYEFHRRFRGFPIVAVHPGMVRTRLVRSMRNPAFWLLSTATRVLLQSPEQGARPLVQLATCSELASGRYYDRFTPAASSPQSMCADTARKLWEITEKLRGPFVAMERT